LFGAFCFCEIQAVRITCWWRRQRLPVQPPKQESISFSQWRCWSRRRAIYRFGPLSCAEVDSDELFRSRFRQRVEYFGVFSSEGIETRTLLKASKLAEKPRKKNFQTFQGEKNWLFKKFFFFVLQKDFFYSSKIFFLSSKLIVFVFQKRFLCLKRFFCLSKRSVFR